MKSSMTLFIVILTLVWSVSDAQVQPKTLTKNTAANPAKITGSPGTQGIAVGGSGSSGTAVGGRGVIVGAEGAAYKTVRSNFSVIYESDVVNGVIKAKKAKKMEVKDQPPAETSSAAEAVAARKMQPQLTGASIGYIENNSIFNLAGELVPGAEIYVELDPNDGSTAKRVSVTPNAPLQVLSVKSSTSSTPPKINIYVKLNESNFPSISSENKKLISSGIYIFGVETTFNKEKYFNEFAVVIGEPAENLSFTSGPFSQSLSNIPDNGRLINPGIQNNVEVGARVFLMNSFTSMGKQD